MKKLYAASWAGGLAACSVALISANHCVKKYGEKLNKNKITVVKAVEGLNKGLDLVDKLIK